MQGCSVSGLERKFICNRLEMCHKFYVPYKPLDQNLGDNNKFSLLKQKQITGEVLQLVDIGSVSYLHFRSNYI
jgi:hypothetical protein